MAKLQSEYNIDDVVAISNQQGQWKVLDFEDSPDGIVYQCVKLEKVKNEKPVKTIVLASSMVLIKKHTKKMTEQEEKVKNVKDFFLAEEDELTEEEVDEGNKELLNVNKNAKNLF